LARALLWALALIAAPAQAALDPAPGRAAWREDSDAKVDAIRKLTASEDPRALEILAALNNEALALIEDGRRAVIVGDGRIADAVTGTALGPAPASLDSVVINNRIRGEIGAAIAALKLGSPDRTTRLGAAKELQGTDNEDALPIIQRSLARETDDEVRQALQQAGASLALKSEDPERRLAAARELADSSDPQVRQLLATMVTRERDGGYRADAACAPRRLSLDEMNSRLRTTELGLALFSGLGLGSVLLLAALGLAITYGLMGIINMAHGEFLMVGAYATYVVQGLFRQHLPGLFDWYVLAALPVAFVVTAGIGMALERGVLRWLYGRPLETLLTTWGVSLLLIQASRTVFGAQNVEVENPGWLSGGSRSAAATCCRSIAS
jgi:urea transport system permease protein